MSFVGSMFSLVPSVMALRSKCSSSPCWRKTTGLTWPILVVVPLLCADLLSLENSQLLWLLAGAMVQLFWNRRARASKGHPNRPNHFSPAGNFEAKLPADGELDCPAVQAKAGRDYKTASQARLASTSASMRLRQYPHDGSCPRCRKMSPMCRCCLSHMQAELSKDWDTAVEKLADKITLTPHAEKAIKQLAHMAKHTLAQLIPEAEVDVFISQDLPPRSQIGMALPRLSLVLKAPMSILRPWLCARLQRTHGASSSDAEALYADLDDRQVHKAAIRACASELIASGSFKFRRCTFQGEEPSPWWHLGYLESRGKVCLWTCT